MDQNRLFHLLRHLGLMHPFNLHFKPDGFAGLKKLILLESDDLVRITSDRQQAGFEAKSERWLHPARRTIQAYLTIMSHTDDSLRRISQEIADSIENITLWNTHRLQELMTGRVKKREGASDQIIREFVNPSLQTLEDLNISVNTKIEMVEGVIPILWIDLADGKKLIGRIGLNGWCGRLHLPDGNFSREMATPDLVAKTIMELVERYTAT